MATACDILAPCVIGDVININDVSLPQLARRIVVGAANNPLADPVRHPRELAAVGILYGPDFIANAGGLIVDEEQRAEFGEEREQRIRPIGKIGPQGTRGHAPRHDGSALR